MYSNLSCLISLLMLSFLFPVFLIFNCLSKDKGTPKQKPQDPPAKQETGNSDDFKNNPLAEKENESSSGDKSSGQANNSAQNKNRPKVNQDMLEDSYYETNYYSSLYSKAQQSRERRIQSDPDDVGQL